MAKYHDGAMLVVTHELPFELHAADRVILMDKGRIVETGVRHRFLLSRNLPWAVSIKILLSERFS